MISESLLQIPLGTLVESTQNWNPRGSCSVDRFRYIDIAAVDRVRKCIREAEELFCHDAPSRARQLVRTGDVLVSTVRPNLNAVAFVDEELDGATASTGFSVLRPRPESLDARYLFHWVRTPRFVRELERQATGASYPAVSDSIIKSTRIPVPTKPDGSPDLDEQGRIATILDKADAIRRKRQETIQLTEELPRSTFLEMFGDPVTNPKGWPTSTLGDLIDSGPQNGLYRPASDYGTGVPIVRIDSFYAGMLDTRMLKRVRVPDDVRRKFATVEDDILINRVNSPKYLGKCACVPALSEFTVYESNMMRLTLRLELAEPRFVVSQLQDQWVRGQIATMSRDAVNQSSINQQDVKAIQLRLPPIALQERFRSNFDGILGTRMQLEGTIAQSSNLFNSLVQRAFRGDL